ncbi:glucose-6-phosphate 1-dehydrogenase [Microbacterium halimionae]|uniref:Glucose-6-phosphate 1-dehydrogenase n=1 Tax=Microbacterium halimionae TaxID=1526413 RepID=A0A7W3JQH4_9MICO|nr:glucose-6-phosphate dehydrogenase [Microbacterium halimionae]MBA8817160.1 glucose-6-phosphate 1-dehydrogenase [Microbacterium halimionae]NII94610.1 glucose-6-phosphate 1-dehydrogenase [Microbacterium halimionae]
MTSATATHTVILVGASGDLAERLLLPGLATLLEHSDREVSLIGTSRHEWEDGAWEAMLERSSESAGFAKDRLSQLLVASDARTVDPSDPDQLRSLLEDAEGSVALYLALPPAAMQGIGKALLEVGAPDDLRLVLEKPFGESGDDARDLNALVSRVLPEERIFRVDHFLGMNAVLGLLGMRFANRLIEPAWSADTIERVEIVFDEEIALEGRSSFYEGTGALVDMLQSHLLNVLALAAMERPESMDAGLFRDAMAGVLAATRLDGDPADASRRARYTASHGTPSYVDEDGVDASGDTETLAELRLAVDTPRWKGVPFILRSGKALGTNRRLLTAVLARAEGIEGLGSRPQSDRISVDLETGQVSLTLSLNADADPFSLAPTTAETHTPAPTLLPYGQVLAAVLDGVPLLAVRGDVAERCWDIVEPALTAWRANLVPLQEYAAGSDGPEDSLTFP